MLDAWQTVSAVLLTASGGIYLGGVARLWRNAGRGRGLRPLNLALFAAGLAAAGLALVSPFPALSQALFWHVPRLFERALENQSVHAFQHLCFFGTAALFWWTLVQGRYGRAGYGAGVLFVFLTSMHSGILGALMTLGRTLWYPAYDAPARAAGVDPLRDQQLAGLIMWIPAGIIFMVVGLALCAAWLGEAERRGRLSARSHPPQPPYNAGPWMR